MKRVRTTITLTGADACLIIRKDGSVEVIAPEGEAGDLMPCHVVVLMGVAQHLDDEGFCQAMAERVAEDCLCDDCKEKQETPVPGRLN